MVRHLRLVLAGVGVVAAAVFAPIVRGQQGSGLPVAQQFDALHYPLDRSREHVGPHQRTSRCTRRIPRSSGWVPRTAACGKRRTTARRSRRSSSTNGLMSIGDRRRVAEEPGPRLARHRRRQQPPEHLVGRRDLQVHRRRHDTGSTWASRNSYHINRIVIDPDEQQHRARRGAGRAVRARAATAASTRRPTAARRGSKCSRSTTTRARTTW